MPSSLWPCAFGNATSFGHYPPMQQLAPQISQIWFNPAWKKLNNDGTQISMNGMLCYENKYFMTIFQNLWDRLELQHLPASVLEIFSDTFEAHN